MNYLIFVRFMPDNGDGEKKIWRIEDMAPVEVKYLGNLHNFQKSPLLRYLRNRPIFCTMETVM